MGLILIVISGLHSMIMLGDLAGAPCKLQRKYIVTTHIASSSSELLRNNTISALGHSSTYEINELDSLVKRGA